MKNIKKVSSENYHFYSREILQYIARTGLRNVMISSKFMNIGIKLLSFLHIR